MLAITLATERLRLIVALPGVCSNGLWFSYCFRYAKIRSHCSKR
jgi:hypothetical protein